MSVLINWDLGLSMFGTEEVQTHIVNFQILLDVSALLGELLSFNYRISKYCKCGYIISVRSKNNIW